MPTVHKKLFCDYKEVHPKIIVHNWNPKEGKDVQLKRLRSPHLSQVCVPAYLMRELVRATALHDGWDVTEILLSDAWLEEEAELKRIIQKTRENRGYYIAVLDQLAALDKEWSLAVETMTIADGDGNSICVSVNGELIETGDAEDLEKAVVETTQNYLA